MSKKMEINGKRFDVIKPRTCVPDAYHKDRRGRRSIWDFYRNPSKKKEDIWSAWKSWADSTPEVKDMRVTGANCDTFSIGAYYIDPDTEEILGYIKITKCYNRLYLFA